MYKDINIKYGGTKMRYKTRFPESYNEGRGNITLTLSIAAVRKLQEIDNKSGYVNDLIIDDLSSGESVETKMLIAQVNQKKSQLEKQGYGVQIFKIPTPNEVKEDVE
jgi:hypothetical protein